MAKDLIVLEIDQPVSKVEKTLVIQKLHKRAKQASLLSFALPLAACGGDDATSGGGDVLLTMPVLADKAWFIHAHMGRVRACTADGASVTGDRPGPRCSNWTE